MNSSNNLPLVRGCRGGLNLLVLSSSFHRHKSTRGMESKASLKVGELLGTSGGGFWGSNSKGEIKRESSPRSASAGAFKHTSRGLIGSYS